MDLPLLLATKKNWKRSDWNSNEAISQNRALSLFLSSHYYTKIKKKKKSEKLLNMRIFIGVCIVCDVHAAAVKWIIRDIRLLDTRSIGFCNLERFVKNNLHIELWNLACLLDWLMYVNIYEICQIVFKISFYICSYKLKRYRWCFDT